MSDANPTGLIKELIKDFEYLIQDIENPMSKTWMHCAYK